MSGIEGKNSIIYIKDNNVWFPIGCETSNSMSEDAETISTTTRDNQGWTTELVTNQSYSFSVEALMINDNDSSKLSYWKLRTKKRNRELIYWKRKYINQNVEEIGKAIITNISDSASTEDYITFSLTLKGFGKPGEIRDFTGGEVDYNNTPININPTGGFIDITNDY